VVLAEADFPFLEVFWTMILFFLWVAWIWTVIAVLGDVYRREDIGGWGKAGWTVLVIVVPFLGVLIYLIAHGAGMAERRMREAQAAQKAYEAHIQEVAGGGGAAAEIAKAKELRDAGTITDAEYEQIKQRALA
jgi:hypothetical protein